MGTTIVTDEDGNEYRVDEDDLSEFSLEEELEACDTQIDEVHTRLNESSPWDLVVELKRGSDGTRHVFGGDSSAAEVLEEAGYEPEFEFYETYRESIYPNQSGGLYFTLNEL